MGTLLLFLSSALWGLVHSLLASLKVKEAIQQALNAPAMSWYRLAYNLFAVISFLPVMILASFMTDKPLYAIPVPWLYATLVIQLAAVIALAVGLLQTDVWSFIGLRQVMGGESRGSIVTDGLYRYVRHPLYAAGLVFIWFTPVMTWNRFVLYFSLTLYIIIGAYFEERKLLREFGRDYYEYKVRTPMLIPFLVLKRS